MNLIPPTEIAGKVMTLIQEAEKELIIVSPYVNIAKWGNMKRCLRKAVERGVDIKFIVRAKADQDLSDLTQAGITPILVQDLHAKLYINDKYAIVTSQNVTQYSDINSIDIAYETQSKRERTELIDFVDKYIYNLKPKTDINASLRRREERSYFQKVTESNRQKEGFNGYQVERLYRAFIDNFTDSYFKSTSSYVFSSDLLPFADVMASSTLVIKIKKSRKDCDEVLEKLEAIAYKGYLNYRIELLVSHSRFYYLEFIPTNAIELQKLTDDYISIISKMRSIASGRVRYANTAREYDI